MSISVVELFAGVGGFRVGLEAASPLFKTVWANQWEPSTKSQPAWECYEKAFGVDSCTNVDINQIPISDIPEFDMLVGGFPCQDYSVAKSLKYSSGIVGKKGVLWWNIHAIVKERLPSRILLENVDRLLSSPAKQKGRDFAIILKSLMDLGYHVEWRVINAADYGFPQKRKRTFIYAALPHRVKYSVLNPVLLKTLPAHIESSPNSIDLSQYDLVSLSDSFGKNLKVSPFKNAGYAVNGKVTTYKAKATFGGFRTVLGDIVEPLVNVPQSFIISETELEKWKVFKLGRKIERTTSAGHKYLYAEGKMAFPDLLTNPARTIITGEGGAAPSRFKHIILQDGVWRRLMPIELERINMFPDNHTAGTTDVKRAFLMGNALVTGVVTKIGEAILESEK